MLEEYADKIVPKGRRNAFTFAAGLELKCRSREQITEDEAFRVLRNDYDYQDLRSFTEKEQRAVIKNALKPRFVRPITERNLRDPLRWGLLPAQPHAVGARAGEVLQ